MLKPDLSSLTLGPMPAGRPLQVVICGEVNAGKSTVLNVLLKANLVPHFIGSPNRPQVMVRHRSQSGLFLQQGELPPAPVASLHSHDPARSTAHCIVHSDAAHLAGFDLIELPFLQDGKLSEQALSLVASADVMIWTTIASQAWRLTEKNIIEQLGKRRPAHSILAVTRADKLRNSRDAERIRDRLRTETGAYFQDILFVAGAPDRIEASASSVESWQATAGQALHEALLHCAGQLRPRTEAPPAEAAVPPAPEVVVEVEAAPVQDPPAARSSVVTLSDYRPPMPAAAPIPPVPPVIELPPAEAPASPFGAPLPLSATSTPATEEPAEAVAATGLTLRKDDMDQVRKAIAETIPDFACVGVLRMCDGAEVTLVGDARQGSALATLVRQIIIASDQGGGFETSSIILSDHCLTFQAAGETGLIVYAMSQNASVNAGIARSAILRFAAQVPAIPLD